jgi:hypothetical protein
MFPAIMPWPMTVCRMPPEAEIYCQHPLVLSTLRGRLRLFLQLEEYGGADNQTTLLPKGPRSSTFTGDAAAAALLKSMSVGIRLAEVSGDNKNADLPSFSALAARTVFWYRGAERLLRRELATIISKAGPTAGLIPTPLAWRAWSCSSCTWITRLHGRRFAS